MLQRLKVGILLDSYQIPAWAWEMIQVILEQDLARIDFVILNQSPKPSGSKSPFLYRLFSKVDRTFFKVRFNAFSREDIREIPGFQAEVFQVKPIQKKYTDQLELKDLALIQSQNPDLIIRLGFRILKGEILTLPKLGIWSFHHGDNLVNRGGPPCFWEVMLGWQETGSVLQILSEKLDEGKVIYRSWSRTDPLSVHRNANKVYWKSLFFIPRQLERINRIGIEAWENEIRKWNQDFISVNPKLLKPPGNGEMISLFLSWAKRNLFRKLNEINNKETWNVWLLNSDKSKRIKIGNPQGSYLADPSLIEMKDQSWLFTEQYEYQSRKGFISCAKVENGKVGDFLPVVMEPFHLSYPFVFQEKEAWWMLVESATQKELRIYQAKDFPFKWTLAKQSFQDQELYDPTLCKKDGLYWLFANQKAHSGASSFDELFLYYSEDFLTEAWNAHPQNPIVSDVKSSRPAGKLFKKKGKWYRPAQDSAKNYGHRIRIQEIIKWDKEEYLEKTSHYIEADWEEGLQGTHTINSTENWIVMDSFKRK